MTDSPSPAPEALVLRPEVAAFAQLMERELRANDYKPGWKDGNPDDLAARVEDECVELTDAVSRAACYSPMRTDHLVAVGEEAADVANMAMMTADVCGALPDMHSQRPSPPADGLVEALQRGVNCIMRYADEGDLKAIQVKAKQINDALAKAAPGHDAGGEG